MAEIKDAVLPEEKSQCFSKSTTEDCAQEINMQPKNPFLQLLKSLDEKISLLLSVSATKDSTFGYLRPYLKALEISCHGIPWLSICMFSLWVANTDETEAFFLNILFALLLDIILVAVLKCILRRKRPKNNESDMFFTLSIDKMSCPSGHTSRAIMMALILIKKLPSLTLLHPLLMLWSISTCASRVMLGRHFVGDVFVGAALGLFEYHLMDVLWLDESFCQWFMSFFKSVNILLGDDL